MSADFSPPKILPHVGNVSQSCVDPLLIEFRIVRIIHSVFYLLFLEDIDRIRPIRRLAYDSWKTLSDCPKKYFLTKSYIT